MSACAHGQTHQSPPSLRALDISEQTSQSLFLNACLLGAVAEPRAGEARLTQTTFAGPQTGILNLLLKQELRAIGSMQPGE